MGFKELFKPNKPKGKSPDYHKEKIKRLMEQSKYKKAICECELYFNCSEGEPADIIASIQRYYGYFFLMIENYDRAIKELKKALNMEPTNYTKYLAYSNLGNIYEKLHKYNKAMHNYKESLKYAENEDDRQIVEIFIRFMKY